MSDDNKVLFTNMVVNGFKLHISTFFDNVQYVLLLAFATLAFYFTTVEGGIFDGIENKLTFMIIELIIQGLIQIAVLIWVYNNCLTKEAGKQPSWKYANKNFNHSYLTLLAINVVVFAFVLVIVLGPQLLMSGAEKPTAGVPTALPAQQSSGQAETVISTTAQTLMLVMAFAWLVMMPLMIYLVVRLCMLIPAIVFEKKGFIDSFKRSFALTKDRFWYTFGVIIALFVVVFIGRVIINLIVPNVAIAEAIFLVLLYAAMPATLTTYYVHIRNSEPSSSPQPEQDSDSPIQR